jgi:hypothetical protein
MCGLTSLTDAAYPGSVGWRFASLPVVPVAKFVDQRAATF